MSTLSRFCDFTYPSRRSRDRASCQASTNTASMIDGRGSLSAIAARDGPAAAIAFGLMRARAELATEPDLAAELIAELWQIAERDGDEFERSEVLDLQLKLLDMRAERLHILHRRPRRRQERSVAYCVARIKDEIGDKHPAELADAMLGLAAGTLRDGNRSLGQDLVRAAIAIDPAHPGTFEIIHMYLIGRLFRAQAAADEGAGRHSDALTGYVRAAFAFSCSAFPARGMTCLEQMDRLAALNSDTADAAVMALSYYGSRFQGGLPQAAMALTASALRMSSGPLSKHFVPDVALFRDQVAKGLLFSAAVAAPRPVSIDETGQEHLRQIDALTPTFASPDPFPLPEAIDEAMVTSVIADTEMMAGLTSAERRMNLQRSFDEHLTRRLYTAGSEAPFFKVSELRAHLAPNAVFVSLFLGVAPDRDLAAVHAQAVTASSYDGCVTPLPLPPGPVSGEMNGVRLTYSAVAGLVTHIRRQLQEDPMFDDVDAEAASHLGLLHVWLGRFSAQLGDWQRVGHDHLIIWPHGPTHYLPWHLYRAAGTSRPLADDWTVTVAPALGMLGRPITRAGTRMVSIGCAKAGVAFGLPAVESLPPQAHRVATAFRTTALAENEATPTRVAEALPGAGYIHIATHASHLAQAPAFQCLYLTPGDNGEGRLFAYQIAALDLRGVQLVTLCACESALGRFDVADNLRGLSAAFLAAGASSVIAALWPVAADPASTFFSSLYENLASGGSSVSAFKAAQSATRRIHNEYRDWGAFSFIGDWRV